MKHTPVQPRPIEDAMDVARRAAAAMAGDPQFVAFCEAIRALQYEGMIENTRDDVLQSHPRMVFNAAVTHVCEQLLLACNLD